jgi:SAM-dependent methyltransferase
LVLLSPRRVHFSFRSCSFQFRQLCTRAIRRELRLLAMEAAMTAQRDVWASGDRYEPYVGRWSRLVARDFVDWLGVPPGKRWLDVGCGTGALAQTALDRAAPDSVFGIDPSEGFLANARRYIEDKRARFEIADAQSLPVADGAFEVAVSGLVLNFVPDPAKAAREMRRAVASGGTVAAYLWDYAGEMQMMRRFWDAAVALDPAAREKDEGVRFPLCQPEPFAALGFRRFLDAVPERPSARARLLHVAQRRPPRRPARAPPRDIADASRRFDPPHRPRLGRARGEMKDRDHFTSSRGARDRGSWLAGRRARTPDRAWI